MTAVEALLTGTGVGGGVAAAAGEAGVNTIDRGHCTFLANQTKTILLFLYYTKANSLFICETMATNVYFVSYYYKMFKPNWCTCIL